MFMTNKEDIWDKLKGVISYLELVNIFEGKKHLELEKILLVCIVCGHKDIVYGMRKKTSDWISSNDVSVGGQRYEVFFHCPKCKGSAIKVVKSEIPKIIAHVV